MSTKSNKARCKEWTQQQIAEAEYFVACLYLGQGKYHKVETSTLGEARTKREEMQQQLPKIWKRSVMIYAVTKGDNLSIFVE